MPRSMRDTLYDTVPFRLSEIEHRYGANVHIVATRSPHAARDALREGDAAARINRLVALLYETSSGPCSTRSSRAGGSPSRRG